MSLLAICGAASTGAALSAPAALASVFSGFGSLLRQDVTSATERSPNTMLRANFDIATLSLYFDPQYNEMEDVFVKPLLRPPEEWKTTE
jgi:hypothetical protein